MFPAMERGDLQRAEGRIERGRSVSRSHPVSSNWGPAVRVDH